MVYQDYTKIRLNQIQKVFVDIENNSRLRIAAEVIKFILYKLKDKRITNYELQKRADIIIIFITKNHKKNYFKYFKKPKITYKNLIKLEQKKQ